MPTIQTESPRSDDVLGPARQGGEFALAFYPAERYYGLDIETPEAGGVLLFVARDSGAALGIALIVGRGNGPGEITRMRFGL